MHLNSCIYILILMAAVVVQASAENDELACSLITKAEAEKLLGPVIDEPKNGVETVSCAGYCPMRGENSSACDFVTSANVPPDKKKSLRLEVDLPPFPEPSWPKHAYKYFSQTDERATVQDVRWSDGTAVWYFRPDQSHGLLDVFISHRVWLEVIEDGVADGDVALGNAKLVASRALARFDAQTKRAP